MHAIHPVKTSVLPWRPKAEAYDITKIGRTIYFSVNSRGTSISGRAAVAKYVGVRPSRAPLEKHSPLGLSPDFVKRHHGRKNKRWEMEKIRKLLAQVQRRRESQPPSPATVPVHEKQKKKGEEEETKLVEEKQNENIRL